MDVDLMRLMRWCSSFLLLLFSAVPGMPQPSPAAEEERVAAEVDAYLKPYLDAGAFSGAVLIARGGKVILSKGYGMANYELDAPNTPQIKFHIASVSKSFTAAAILLLEERGLLKTTDPLSKHIPDYPSGGRITLHHLLTHTSGIPNVNNFPDYDEKSKFPHTTAALLAMFKDKPLVMEPGARYNYSNSNYNVLAYIIEKVSGQSYGQFLRENIFDPLGMRDTGHDVDATTILKNVADGYVPVRVKDLAKAPYLDWTIKTGNGSLYSTVEDLYRWDRALYTERLLKKATRERMFTAHVEGVGYGWFISRRHSRRAIRMSGRSPGFGSEIARYVDEDLCVIVLSNNYAATAGTIANDLAAVALGEKYEMPPPVVRPVALTAQALHAYTGRYQGGEDFFVPGVSLNIEKKGGELQLTYSLGGVVMLLPLSETKFLDRPFWATLTFVRTERGEVMHIVYRSGGTDYVAKKVPAAAAPTP